MKNDIPTIYGLFERLAMSRNHLIMISTERSFLVSMLDKIALGDSSVYFYYIKPIPFNTVLTEEPLDKMSVYSSEYLEMMRKGDA